MTAAAPASKSTGRPPKAPRRPIPAKKGQVDALEVLRQIGSGQVHATTQQVRALEATARIEKERGVTLDLTTPDTLRDSLRKALAAVRPGTESERSTRAYIAAVGDAVTSWVKISDSQLFSAATRMADGKSAE